MTIALAEQGVMSPTGSRKTFDANADGLCPRVDSGSMCQVNSDDAEYQDQGPRELGGGETQAPQAAGECAPGSALQTQTWPHPELPGGWAEHDARTAALNVDDEIVPYCYERCCWSSACLR
ncbi:Highly reducing polyketide synthase FUM1 [Zalerion maritima]|uniref:Highly reducing polyketide synthase FUM1 n=1 Tax=Zalerion maritima TaxID=339359 RepID=A0AAD5RGF9_9PEZI|nr:Highly reducing polyketide synthase FUM1 [Zalerion maritima]